MAAKAQTPSTPTPEAQDAIALLMGDHRRVARLFAEFDELKNSGNDDEKLRVVQQICAELSVHAEIEEEIFYPAVREAIDDDDLMDEAWVEQAGAKNLIAQLKGAAPEDEFYDAKVTVLAEQIDHHVQEEEKDMFPQARAADLDTFALGAQMQRRKRELMEQNVASARGASTLHRDVDVSKPDSSASNRDGTTSSREKTAPNKIAKKNR